jgi:hypothetical protein
MEREGIGSQSVLVRAEADEPPEVSSVRTYAGLVHARSVPVAPAADFTVLIIPETLTPDDLKVLKSALTLFYASVRASDKMSLTRYGSDQIESAAPELCGIMSALQEEHQQKRQSIQSLSGESIRLSGPNLDGAICPCVEKTFL